ncbi:type 2 periplasmic-binding domain-containing protein [Mycolicibacterium mengxianglii]|uniref:hypothetical protein n=1 Tax=Mycolicibacterium mengxianglii TaxID=2736649 RepID=UPI0018EEE524|nr:hypothetical protein [Mycolicibacterium mengxianglii]
MRKAGHRTERMSAGVVADLGLHAMALPFETEPVPVVLAWHQRYDDDRTHAWLRDQVNAAVRQRFPAQD